MEDLLAAILKDDRASVVALLKVDPTLATCVVAEARFFESEIVHGLYARDTALHLASAGYRVEIVRMLLAAGADRDSAKNHRRSTPLRYPSDGLIGRPAWNPARQVETIQCLIDAGAAINAQDKNGATPLHRAVRTR